MNTTLDMIALGHEVIIKKIRGKDKIRRRFFDLGFLPNNKVKCVLISPFKDPKAYKINENIIAIRNIDAKNIEVSYE
ncbi:MAG: ferrous iron transport protein A [Firmicutes bacterium]|nr:ferrous iron transport protein A [Bacillota bacterium]